MTALKSLRFLSDKADPPFWIGGRAAPDPKNLLCCRNGVLDITTRRFYPPAPDLFALDSRGFDYDATAPKPKEWLAFLTSLWPNDQESSDTLATIFGYVLTSATKMQKMFLIIGPARSGKGTISRVLKSIVGSENVAEPALQQLASESDFALQQLIGKRLAIVGDARVSSKADPQAAVERMLKISGEDGMTIGRKYKDDWRGRLGTRFLILANELPDLKDDSGAFAERFILLRLSKSFLGIEDHNLEERLMKERAGILNWALDGLDALRKAKRFKQPDASQGAIDDLNALGSPVRAFIEDRCVTGPLFENGEARGGRESRSVRGISLLVRRQ